MIAGRGINVKTNPDPERVRARRAREERIWGHLSQAALLVVGAVSRLRRTQPNTVRPIRIPLYPLPLLIFGGMSVYMLAFYLLHKTAESLLGFLTLALGYVVYRLAGRTLPP